MAKFIKTTQWDHDAALMHRGIKLMFTNDLSEAEKVFKEGIFERDNLSDIDHDNNGAFALNYALVAVIRGVASLADDSLDECLTRLVEADKLASKSQDWVGKTVIRGICTLEIGLIQCLKHQFVKGVWNILKSWKWVKTLKKNALDYQGQEREVIRSVALMTIGVFELILSLLPSTLMRAASFMSGFKSDRNEALELLWTCFQEKGMLAPWGALIWVSYHVDTKTFLGEKQTGDDFDRCREIFDWVNGEYPNSVFFSGLEADMHACLRDIDTATQITMTAEPYIGQLRAIEWALHYKQGVYALSKVDFFSAGDNFEKSIRVYREVGRRSMVPFMASYALICYQLSDKSAKVKEMLDLLQEYKDMDKKNWGRQDTHAFEVLKRYKNPDSPDCWPLLDIVESMAFRMRCTFFMHNQELETLCSRLQSEMETRDPPKDFIVRVCMCRSEIYTQLSRYEDAIDECNKGLVFDGKLSKSANRFGAIPMIRFLKAKAYAELGDPVASKAELEKLKRYGRNYKLYAPVHFKANALAQVVGSEKEDFNGLDVKAGGFRTIEVDIPAGEVTVDVDWFVEKRNVQFSANFKKADDTEDPTILLDPMKQNSDDGLITSSFSFGNDMEYDDDFDGDNEDDMIEGMRNMTILGPGTLQLKWDNSFSYMRSKVVRYRVNLIVAESFGDD